MSETQPEPFHHDHSFGQDKKRDGEAKTLIVIAITATTMVVEIAAGLSYGSMALLADGLHMASHAAALGISAFAYIYARRHAHDPRFSFGTGKVNALGGFTGAVLLAVFALLMAWESVRRFVYPVQIVFNQAIAVALLGLFVNAVSALILGSGHDHHAHGRDHEGHGDHEPSHGPSHDHNLRAAYLHVLADALTSILAILALLGGKFYGWNWMDPAMGLVGAILVARWSLGLVHTTSTVLLDHQGAHEIRQAIRENLERGGGVRVVDLHLWSIGPNIFSVIVSIVTSEPKPVGHYRNLLPRNRGLGHVTIEIHEDKSCE